MRRNENEEDSDLRETFRTARRDVEREAPRFGAAWESAARRARAPRRGARLAWAAAPALLVLAAFAYLALRTSPRPASLTAEEQVALHAIEEWQAPTDFLMEVPGSDILGSSPSLGRDSQLVIEQYKNLGRLRDGTRSIAGHKPQGA